MAVENARKCRHAWAASLHDPVVNIRPVDPRDTQWEIDHPTYRVYFFDVAAGRSDEFELDDADVSDVLAWADEHASGRQYAVYLRLAPPEGSPGLLRLLGDDPFRNDIPH